MLHARSPRVNHVKDEDSASPKAPTAIIGVRQKHDVRMGIDASVGYAPVSEREAVSVTHGGVVGGEKGVGAGPGSVAVGVRAAHPGASGHRLVVGAHQERAVVLAVRNAGAERDDPGDDLRGHCRVEARAVALVDHDHAHVGGSEGEVPLRVGGDIPALRGEVE